MSRNSLHDFFDSPLDSDEYENVKETSDECAQVNDTSGDPSNTDSDQVFIETQCVYDYDPSDSSLLRDYVVVEMAKEDYTPRRKFGFVPRIKTPYPKLAKNPRQTKAGKQIKRGNETEYEGEPAENTQVIDKDGIREGMSGVCEERESYNHRIRMEHIYIPQVDSSHSTITCTEATDGSDDGDGVDEVGDSDTETEVETSNSETEDDKYYYETDEDEEEEEDSQEEEEDVVEYDTDHEHLEETNNQPYEGRLSVVSRPSNSRITTLNSNLYKTDGEDQVLSDITITRSYAHLHKQEVLDAGAKTIGELYASLKRKKAQERTDEAEENGGSRDTSSTLLIPKRKDENEKLKNKQKLPKSTIPFEEKHVSKTRQKSASDDCKVVIISKKSYTGKVRSSPNNSVAYTSEIHVGPEVRGDMGNATTSAAVAQSVESLTPESLTRLCGTETGYRSSGRIRSIVSQPISDEDSRAGYVSGRKNPQTKHTVHFRESDKFQVSTANYRESSKSRIPLPVNRKGSARSVQHGSSVKANKHSSQGPVPAAGSNWTSNSVTNSNRVKLPEIKGQRFKTQRIQLENPAQLLTKAPPCTVERKPPIPHQMKSTACYYNGKLDVSILGDRELIAKTDPLDVQITLVPYAMTDNPTARNHALPPLKNPPPPPPPRNAGFNRMQNQQSGERKSEKEKTATNTTSHKARREGTANPKRLPSLKRVGRKQEMNAKRTGSNFWAPGKSRMDQKVRQDRVTKIARPLSPIDWNVIRHRAQFPPFNTYTDREASVRFQKIWCGI